MPDEKKEPTIPDLYKPEAPFDLTQDEADIWEEGYSAGWVAKEKQIQDLFDRLNLK